MIWFIFSLGLVLLVLGIWSIMTGRALSRRGPVSRELAPLSCNLGIFFVLVSMALLGAVAVTQL